LNKKCLVLILDFYTIQVGGNGNISTEGSGPNDTPTEAQLEYLDMVCKTTQGSIDYALKELPPTLEPTESPLRPTQSPSEVPTSSVPTASPVGITEAPAVVTTPPTYLERTDSPAVSEATMSSTSPFVSLAPSNGAVTPPLISTKPTVSTASPSSTDTLSIAPSMTNRAIVGGGGTNETTTTTLSSGGIAGIVLASVAVIAAGIVISRKRTRDEDEDPSLEFKGDVEMGNSPGPSPGPSPTNADLDSEQPQLIPPSPPRDTLQALSSPLSPAISSPYSPEKFDLESADDSSSAGQSGWSSSQGLSSLNTASFDAGEDSSLLTEKSDGILMGGSALAAMGVASAVAFQAVKKNSPEMKLRVYNDDDDGSISSDEEMVAVSRKDLDAAIEGEISLLVHLVI
jgi:hypothetical protein